MPKGYKRLTLTERCQISALLKSGLSQTETAQLLGYHKSTISRELSKNRTPMHYEFDHMHTLARRRRADGPKTPRKLTPKWQDYLRAKIHLKWSPEQIAGYMRHHETTTFSHETIYQFIWNDKAQGGDLWTHLRHRGKKYYRNRGKKAGVGLIPNRKDISLRPKVVDKKMTLCHWEMDTVYGKNHEGVLVTMVERFSKYTLIRVVPNRQGDGVTKAILDAFRELAQI